MRASGAYLTESELVALVASTGNVVVKAIYAIHVTRANVADECIRDLGFVVSTGDQEAVIQATYFDCLAM